MGINLGDIVPKHDIVLKELSGKILAFDAYNMLYQFLASIRQEDGTPLMDLNGNLTGHLSGLFYRTARLMEMGIKVVYVFDGSPPPFKKSELERRVEMKRRAEIAFDMAKDLEIEELMKRYAEGSVRLTKEMVEEAKLLLMGMGACVVQAPSEGEAQAAYLAMKGKAYASVSQDYDSLLFGAPRLLRNISITHRRKVPGQNKWVVVGPEQILLEEVLSSLEIGREQLIALALLIGTDFNDGVKGIGPKKGLKVVKELEKWEKIKEFVSSKYNYVFPDYIDEVFSFFLNPPVDDVELNFSMIDEEKVVKLLVDKHDFSDERVRKTCEKVMKAQKEAREQQSIIDWF
jgi:flap endonuclease-1